jgi:hypothetical protein
MCSTTLAIGSRVLYRGSWGTRSPVNGKIVGVDEKNGETVYDVLLDAGEHRERWGYANQFEAVESYAEGYRNAFDEPYKPSVKPLHSSMIDAEERN